MKFHSQDPILLQIGTLIQALIVGLMAGLLIERIKEKRKTNDFSQVD